MKQYTIILLLAPCFITACSKEDERHYREDLTPLLLARPDKSRAVPMDAEEERPDVCIVSIPSVFKDREKIDGGKTRDNEPILAMQAEKYVLKSGSVEAGDVEKLKALILGEKAAFEKKEPGRPFYVEIRADREIAYEQILAVLRCAAEVGITYGYITALRDIDNTNDNYKPSEEKRIFGHLEGQLSIALPPMFFLRHRPIKPTMIEVILRPLGEVFEGCQYEIDNRPPVDNPESLRLTLSSLRKTKGKDAVIVIRPFGFVRWKYVVEAVNAAEINRFRTIGFGPTGISGNGLDTHTGPPKTSFFGAEGNACAVVYVIDISGSMINSFDAVRREMKRSIYGLDESQYFHVIFMQATTPHEFGEKRLVPASRLNKKKISKYLTEVSPAGQTDPVPAMKRAFQVFQGAKKDKKGFLIYLLTDGRFPDSEKVLETIKDLNKDKKVQIFTYLYESNSPDAVKFMKQIAEENNGKYTFVDNPE